MENKKKIEEKQEKTEKALEKVFGGGKMGELKKKPSSLFG